MITTSTQMDLVWRVRPALEDQFPTLVFHFFWDAERGGGLLIRVMRRNYDEDTNLFYSRRGKLGAQMHEEHVDMDMFPTEDFLARMALIA